LESANILRGPVDAADFKTYIFPLLFFKRICDVWDEEYQEIVSDTGDAELALFPEAHRFQISEGCHWSPGGHPNSPSCGHSKFLHPERA
jgi:type I restriction enzyme M protein